MGKRCCVSGCKSKFFRDCGISFFQFPKKEELYRKWVRVINGRIGMSSVVCSLHFKPEEVVTNQHNSKNYLVVNAVPSIFDMTKSPQLPQKDYRQPAKAVSNNARHIDNVEFYEIKYHRDKAYEKYRNFEDDMELQYDEYDSYKEKSKVAVKTIRCKCCLGSGKLKNMWHEYSCDGQEDYGSMLIECFALPWRRPVDLKNNMEYICQPCILRLNDALSFRVEVLASERFLRFQLETTQDEDVDKLQDELQEEDPQFDVTTEYLDYEYLDDSDDGRDEFDKLKEDEDVENLDVRSFLDSPLTCDEELPENDGNQLVLTSAKKRSKRKQQSTEINNTVSDTEASPPAKRIKEDKTICNNTNEDDAKQTIDVMTHNKIIGCLGDVIRYSNATPIGGYTEDGFNCCYCRDQYDSPQNLKRHTLDKHADKVFVNTKEDHVKLDITNLKCLDCESSLSSLDGLILHLQKDHQLRLRKSIHYPIIPYKFDSEELQCAICHKVFVCFDTLSNHMRIHVQNQNKLVRRKLKVGENTFYYASYNINDNSSEEFKEKEQEMPEVTDAIEEE